MKTLALVTAVIASVVGYWYAAPVLFPDDDNGLGAGLAAFMLLGLLAVVGALWDGMHEARLVRVVIRWMLVAGAVGAALPVLAWANEESTTATLAEDVTGTVPFMLVLMGAPAAFFVWLGWAIQRRKRTAVQTGGPGPRARD
jgi:drug/metabolite transporter (DMT)-like permease